MHDQARERTTKPRLAGSRPRIRILWLHCQPLVLLLNQAQKTWDSRAERLDLVTTGVAIGRRKGMK